MNVSDFFTSFFSIQSSGLNPFTSPAMRQAYALASNFVIGPIPERPSTSPCQVGSLPTPSGEIMPIPVTTTRRLFMVLIAKAEAGGVSHPANGTDRRPVPGGRDYEVLARLSMYSTASLTFLIFSASSSEISTPNSSSNAMISSTVSSESAPRSSTNDASGFTSSASTPSCSTMIDLTRSSTDIVSPPQFHLGGGECRAVFSTKTNECRMRVANREFTVQR